MKKTYTKPTVEFIYLGNEDIITTSGGCWCDPEPHGPHGPGHHDPITPGPGPGPGGPGHGPGHH